MKLRLLTVTILMAATLLNACTAASNSAADMTAVEQKLNALDAYKEGLSDNNTVNNDFDAQKGVFRSFYFGMSKEMVQAMETLPLNQVFTDALDYTGSEIYGYDMLLTYWFNSDNLLGSVSYSMQGEAYQDTVNALMQGLRSDYGEPASFGYYDTSNQAMTFDTDDLALQAVESGSAYYSAVWWLDNNIHVEMYARNTDTGYDYWIYYTDYTYYK